MKASKGIAFALFPSIFLILAFKVYPICVALIESLYTMKVGGEHVFVGLSNYINLFQAKVFWRSLWVTIKFNVILTPVQVILAIIMALLVNRSIKGIKLIRDVLYLPAAISMPAASVIWGILLNPNNGVFNGILGFLGMPQQQFLIDQKQALSCIIVMCCWKGVAYWMMFLLAGLQGIPESLYEAAKVEGCGTFSTIFYIVLPMLKRSIAFVLVADTVVNLLTFAPMYSLTSGGPNQSTNVLMYEAYKSCFTYADMGRSYTILVILLILVFIVVSLQMKLMKSTDEY